MAKRKAAPSQYQQINIKLVDPEDVRLYRAMKARAAKRGKSLREFVLALFREEETRKDEDD